MEYSLQSEAVSSYVIAMRQYHGWAKQRLRNGVQASKQRIIIDAFNEDVNWLVTVGIDDDGLPVLGLYDEPYSQWFDKIPWEFVVYERGQITLIPKKLRICGMDNPISVQPLVIILSEGHVMHMRQCDALRLVRFCADPRTREAEIIYRFPYLLARADESALPGGNVTV
jgi:hypothetical protein